MWVEIGIGTNKPVVPEGRDLIGKSYQDGEDTLTVTNTCCIQPTTHVLVESSVTGKSWSVRASTVREKITE